MDLASSDPGLRAFVVAPAVFAAVVFTVAPAHAQSGEDIVRGWLDAMRSGGATVETGGITTTRGKDLLEIRDLRIVPPKVGDKPGGSIRVPSIVFVGLSRSADGGITAKGVKVSDIEGRSDDGTLALAVNGLEGANVALPNFQGLSVDPAKPFTSQIRVLRNFTKIRADSLTIGRVTLDVKTPQTPVHLVYDGVGVTDVADGRVGRFVSGAVRATGTTVENGKSLPIDVRIGKAEVVGYDLDAYLRVFDDAAYVGGRGDGQWRDVQKSASVDGISVVAGPVRFSIARATIGALRMRQTTEPLGAVLDRATADPKAFENDPAQAGRFAMGILRSMAIEHYTFDGWSIEGPELERFLIGRVSLRDFSSDGLGEFSVDGVDAAGQGNVIRLARFAFGGLRFPDGAAIEAAIRSGGSGPGFDPFALAPTLGYVKVDSLSVDVAGKGTVSLGSFSMDYPSYIKAIPTAVRIAMKNFVAPASLADDRNARETLAALGYDKLDLSAELAVRYDERSGDLKLETLSAGLAEGGSAALEATFGNVPRSVFEDPTTADKVWPQVTLKGIGFGYRDASLTQRMLRFVARQQNQSPDAVRDALIAGLPQLLKDVRDPDLRQRASAALTGFLRNPKGLSVVSRLRAPLPITQIIGTVATGPQQLPSLLQLDVAAVP